MQKKIRVIIASRPGKLGIEQKDDSQPFEALLHRCMVKLTGEKRRGSAWRSLFSPDDVVGIKLNCLAGKWLSSSPGLVYAIVKGLREAKVPESNIIIWERSDRELQHAGFTLNKKQGVKCFGSDALNPAYDSRPEIIGSIGSCFSQMVSRYCDALINVPVLKDHDLAGVSIGMKNFYGAIHNPNKYHDNNCDPYVSDVCRHRFIRDKLKLVVCDAVTALCEGGPAYKEQWAWNFGGIICATDPVALDRVGWDVIEARRKKKGLPPLKEVNREPAYIKTAEAAGLGTADPKRIIAERV